MSAEPATVTLPPLASPVREVWHTLLTLAEDPNLDWTLVGGQMVLLHALEHELEPPQISQDGDVIGNVRADQSALRRLVAALEADDYTLSSISTDGIAHRYSKPGNPRPVVVDVMAPEGLGTRADLTTSPPGRTVEVPGGSQALRRTTRVNVLHEGRSALVPRPSLLAAIVGKAAACALPGDSSRHHRDLALLCALVADPFALREELSNKDKSRLMASRRLLDPAHPAWTLLPEGPRRDARAAHGLLLS